MNNRVFYFNSLGEIYYHGMIVAAALLAGIVTCSLLARMQGKRTEKLSRYMMIYGFIIGLFLAREQYCIFNPNDFKTFADLFDLSKGGYGLFGAMGGVYLAALLVSLRSKTDLSTLLDACAPAGAIAIAIGRLAAYFSGEERGLEILVPAFRRFPFAVYNESAGVWRMSVYIYESFVAFVIFAVVLAVYIYTYKKKKYAPGCSTMLFFTLYCGAQMLLESWRTDSLFLNLLGFVRFSQALSAVIAVVLGVYVFIKYAKNHKIDWKQILSWVLYLGFFVLAFICEFTMTGGRGSTATRNYIGMSLSLAIVTAIQTRYVLSVYQKNKNEECNHE